MRTYTCYATYTFPQLKAINLPIIGIKPTCNRLLQYSVLQFKLLTYQTAKQNANSINSEW